MLLFSMFSGAFLAATLLPGGSEVLLLVLLSKQPEMWASLWLMATLGNTLGALSSFYLGYLGRLAKTPEQLTSKKYTKSMCLIQKYGYWGLLLSWTPIIGDILCLFAGWLRLPLTPSVIMIFTGKAIRYAFVTAGFFYFS